MNKKQTLKKLQNDQDYYGDFGRQFLSNSDLNTLIGGQYEMADLRQFKVPVEDNENFLKGRYFHQYILEPEKISDFPVIDVKSRNSKEYKEFLKENGVSLALKESEAVEIKDMARYMLNNFKMYEFIRNPKAKYEVPAVGEIFGEMWKGKADILTDEYVFDIKTSANVLKFGFNARHYFYHTQAYIYQRLFGKPVVFLVIGKTKKKNILGEYYYDMGIFPVSNASLEIASELVKKAVDVYRQIRDIDPNENIDDYIINTSI